MIHPLRRWHRWLWTGLALLLPALLLAALAVRPSPPLLDRLPPELLGTAASPASPSGSGGD